MAMQLPASRRQRRWVLTAATILLPAGAFAARALAEGSPEWRVTRRPTADGVALVATNPCVCTVEFAVEIETAGASRRGHGVVGPGDEALLLEVSDAELTPSARYRYAYVVGVPHAEHRPSRPYRAPFAPGLQFPVSQAPPDAVTHVDDANRHAVDFALPEGTAVHAARAGIVINVAGAHREGGLQPHAAANFVQVLHADGTYAVYAHLQAASVRVRPGQRVERGEWLARSGHTGYGTGPHLHFAVLRNAGLRAESVPLQFEGPGGRPVVPARGQSLRAW
jgi:murein DD-endopeptidase MepM/ murein hydrolase activator NlpD